MTAGLKDAFQTAIDRLNGKGRNQKSVREGEETLKKTLEKMYREFRDRESPKPNYGEKYQTEKGSAEPPAYRDSDALKKESEKYAKSVYDEKRKEAAEDANKKAEDYDTDRKSAEQRYADAVKEARESGNRAFAAAERKIAAQGLGRSSIAEGLLKSAENTEEEALRTAEATYAETMKRTDEKIALVKEKLAAALKGFEIAEAAKAEKELIKLNREQNAEFDRYRKESEAIKAQNERIERERTEAIKADEAKRDADFRAELQARAGAEYEGTEAAEMENRYRLAEAFYRALPAGEAESLALSSKDELKFLLGNYYERLMNALKR